MQFLFQKTDRSSNILPNSLKTNELAAFSARLSWFFTTVFLLFFQPETAAQRLTTDLRTQIFEGKKSAIRDLATLLDRPDEQAAARQFLQEATHFEEAEFAWPTGKQPFLNFFYKNESRLFYDELRDIWRLAPIHQPPVTNHQFQLRPLAEQAGSVVVFKKLQDSLLTALAVRDEPKIIRLTARLAILDWPDGLEFLFVQAKKLDASWPKPVFAAFADALRGLPTEDVLKLILGWAKKSWLDGDEAEYALSVIANHYLGTNVAEVLQQRIDRLRDSLKTLEAIRRAGFEGEMDARPAFFYEPVDYWGRVLSQSGNLPWVRQNVIFELARSKSPRALFYLATQAVRYRPGGRFQAWPGIRQPVFERIEQLVRLKTGVADSTGDISFEPTDRLWHLRFAEFWEAHFNDFEWDERRGFFRNRLKAETLSEEYDRLFRRLSSTNDTAALNAWTRLAEGEPAEIMRLAEQYRQMVRSFNPLLPSFKYRFLESVVQLTAFCRDNGIDWQNSPKLDSLVKKLDDEPAPAMRYQLENEAVSWLKLTDATALERLACQREHDLPFGFSASRMLDLVYSKEWQRLIEDDFQLRLFLKKSALFGQIGTVGVCNFYLQKFLPPTDQRPAETGSANSLVNYSGKLSADIKTRLQRLDAVETDEDIHRQIAKLLGIQLAESSRAISWNFFFKMPDSLKINELGQLPALDKKTRKQFFKNLNVEKSPRRAAIYLTWLDGHATFDEAENLLRLLEDPRRDSLLDVPARVEKLLQKLFLADLNGPLDQRIAAWLGFEKVWGRNWRDWQFRFFEQRLAQLQTRDSLAIDDLNRVTTSPLFQPLYKTGVLSALVKVRPAATIKRLIINPKLVAPADLAFFEPISLGYRDLDDLARLFQTEEVVPLLRFFMEKSAGFTPVNRGIFINELIRQDWLRTWINTLDQPNDLTRSLRKVLLSYLDDDELSEFEEGQTLFNLLLLDNAGLRVRQKLLAADSINVDATTRGKLQREILAGISWEELPEVVPMFDRLVPGERGEPGWQFLTKDFGLPPLDYARNADNSEFLTLLKTKPEAEVMEFYLRKFGLEIRQPGGEFDWQKIADLLAFDITTPFAGGGGERRDWTVFGILKILEGRFGTRLGWHEKLNENQTFYTFNASKRAAAWLRVLSEKGLLTGRPGSSGAFIRIQ